MVPDPIRLGLIWGSPMMSYDQPIIYLLSYKSSSHVLCAVDAACSFIRRSAVFAEHIVFLIVIVFAKASFKVCMLGTEYKCLAHFLSYLFLVTGSVVHNYFNHLFFKGSRVDSCSFFYKSLK